MARRLNLTINSTFNPFTFAEMMQPFQVYKDYYDKNEALATSLQEQANEWEEKARAEQDSVAHQQVKKYADDLRHQAERLVKQGMSPGLRADLQTMKSRFKSEVTPIEDAYNLRTKLADEQRLARLKDPSLRFDVDYSTASLDSLLGNPTASYNQWSLNDAYTKTASVMQTLASQMAKEPRYKQILGGKFLQVDNSMGFTDKDINNAMMGNSAAPAALVDAINQARASYGYDRMDPYQKQEFDNMLYSASQMGREQHRYSTMNNPKEASSSDPLDRILTKAAKLAQLNKLGYTPVYNDKGELTNFNYDPSKAESSGEKSSPLIGMKGATLHKDALGQYSVTDEETGKTYATDEEGYPKNITDPNDPYLKKWDATHPTSASTKEKYAADPITFQKAFGDLDYTGSDHLKDFNLGGGSFSDTDVSKIYIPEISNDSNLHVKVKTKYSSEPLEQFKVSQKMYTEIQQEVHKRGLKMSDVVILMDQDYGSDNEFKIVLRDRTVDGKPTGDSNYWVQNLDELGIDIPAEETKEESEEEAREASSESKKPYNSNSFFNGK